MENKKHYYSLDFLKFLLSILILFHHFQMTTLVDFGKIDFVEGIFNFAMLVEFFFIISGFLSGMTADKTGKSSFETFIGKKIRRLYPTAILSVIVMTVLIMIDYLLNGVFRQGLVPDIFKFFNSILITFSGYSIKVGRGINNPLWYVGVLMICYIIFYLILRISERNGIKPIYLFVFVCLLGIGIHDYGIDLPFANEDVSRGYAAFFYGLILYELYRNYSHRFLYLFSYLTLIVCGLLFIINYTAFYQYQWGSFVFVIFPCVLFVFLSLENYLGFKFFQVLGGVSYEIYVWHSLFNHLILMSENILKPLYDQPFLFLGIYTLIVVLFSYVMYSFVEKPLTKAVISCYSKIRKQDAE
ncbi:MAG: acyltransferase [Erysipelotrichaceae bacterium]|nr:acyltransferase [Erysipelotrichaceae bacterium]